MAGNNFLGFFEKNMTLQPSLFFKKSHKASYFFPLGTIKPTVRGEKDNTSFTLDNTGYCDILIKLNVHFGTAFQAAKSIAIPQSIHLYKC